MIDADGALVTPGFVDPHSHLLYGGTRHQEYEAKVSGSGTSPGLQSGINYTVRHTRNASDRDLVGQALADLDTMLEHGTTTLEAKTGYGLDRETELRLLRLTSGLDHPIEVITTYLGAHVLPSDYAGRRNEYLDLVIELLPEAARLAEYCDVCCDPVSFTFDECLRIGEAAGKLGMGIRVHADQTGDARGAFLAAQLNAASADHLDYTTDAGFAAMAKAGTTGNPVSRRDVAYVRDDAEASRPCADPGGKAVHAAGGSPRHRVRLYHRAFDRLQSRVLPDTVDADGHAARRASVPIELCRDLEHVHAQCRRLARARA